MALNIVMYVEFSVDWSVKEMETDWTHNPTQMSQSTTRTAQWLNTGTTSAMTTNELVWNWEKEKKYDERASKYCVTYMTCEREGFHIEVRLFFTYQNDWWIDTIRVDCPSATCSWSAGCRRFIPKQSLPMPPREFLALQHVENSPVHSLHWWCRLSIPGYLTCTLKAMVMVFTPGKLKSERRTARDKGFSELLKVYQRETANSKNLAQGCWKGKCKWQTTTLLWGDLLNGFVYQHADFDPHWIVRQNTL